MPQAIVKPEEVRVFAAELKRFNEELKNDYSKTHARFKQLSETWRDQEYKKFEKEFEMTARSIKQFLAASDQYVPFLIRKAEAADEYIKMR